MCDPMSTAPTNLSPSRAKIPQNRNELLTKLQSLSHLIAQALTG